MAKRLCALFAVLAISLGVAYGCAKKIELVGFDVIAEDAVSYGADYTVPVYNVRDKDGKIYSVNYTVTNGGNPVEVVGGKFTADKITDYLITYTVAVSEKRSDTKTTVVKVNDTDRPFVSLGEMERYYIVGEKIEPPVAKVRDNYDQNLTAKMSLYKGDALIAESVTEAFTVNEEGIYKIVATATDSSDNVSEEAVREFVVRNPAAKGEIEDFEASAFAGASVNAVSNYGNALKSGYGEVDGVNAFYVSSVTENTEDTLDKYPGVRLVPRISKDEINALKADGYDKITMRVYLDYSGPRTLYHQWAVNEKTGKHVQTNLGNLAAKSWTDFELDLDLFIAAYDDIASGNILFLYVGNEAEYTPDKAMGNFKLFIADIYVVKELSDITLDLSSLETEYALNAEADVSKATASSKTETDAQFEVKIISPLGEALVAENGKITFAIPGIYTVRATPVQKSLRGAAESEITVKASVADVNAAVKEINDTEDKTTAAIKEKAALLKAAYATLTEEEKGQIDTFDYILAITLESEKENVFYQFDSEVGREQVGIAYTAGSPAVTTSVSVKNGITVDNSVKYGDETASTKIEFTDVPVEWFGVYTLKLNVPSHETLSDFGYLKFYLKGYTYKADRPVTYYLQYDGEYIDGANTPVALTGDWQEVVVSLDGITDLSKLTINFCTLNNGNAFGSVWNESGRFYVHISNVYGVIKTELAVSPEFEYKELYSVNETVDLSSFAVSSADYPDLEFKYTLTDNSGAIQDMPDSYTFTESGIYTVTAEVVGEDLIMGKISVTFTVRKTLEEVQAAIAALDEIEDKTGAEYAAAAEEIRKDFSYLSEEDKAQIDQAAMYAKLNNVTIADDNKLFYFDTAFGIDQITTAINKDVPLLSKKGISVDKEVKYGNEGASLKIEFTDAADAWFGPYVVNLVLPAHTDISAYDYLVFRARGFSRYANRPVTLFIQYNGKYIAGTNPPVALGDGWTEFRIPTDGITDFSKLQIKFNSRNGSDSWASVSNIKGDFYVNLSCVYGLSVLDDIEVNPAFSPAESYNTGDTLNLSEFTVSSETAPDAVFVYTVVLPDGSEIPMPESLTLNTAGRYMIKATYSSGATEGLYSCEIIVKANNTIFAFNNADGKSGITTAFVTGNDAEVVLTKKDAIVLDETSFYGTEGASTKIGFDDVKDGVETWCCPFTVYFTGSSADLSVYDYIVFRLKGFSYNQARPLSYALKYDGKYINGTNTPNVLATGVWQEIVIYLDGITDLSKLALNFYTKNGTTDFASVWNSSARFYANISNMYGITEAEFSETYGFNANTFAAVNEQGTFINSAGYGTDLVKKSYVENYNGKPAWKTETDPAAGCSSNAYKWPAVNFTNCLFTADALAAKKEQGFTKIVVPIFIEASAETKKLCWGVGDKNFDTVNCNEWAEVELSIDDVIAGYAKIGTYFIYFENSATVDYITYYVSDAYFA